MKPTTPIRRIFAAAKKNDELELLIYDSIGDSWFGGGVTAKDVQSKLAAAGDIKKIVLRINSPGGDVFEGAAIYSLLSQHKAEVECFVDGLAASAAFTIAMAADKVHISESAMMMCHNAFGMCAGGGEDMRKMGEILDKVSGTMRDVYASHSGMTPEECQGLMDAETWMTASEAVKYGFADDVIKRDAEQDAAAYALLALFDLSKFAKTPENLKPKSENTNGCLCIIGCSVNGDCPIHGNKAEAKPQADSECDCACAECEAGNCAECSDPECDDPNCEHTEASADESGNIAMLREQFSVSVL